VVPPKEPCALRSTQPLQVSTRNYSWGKGGRCVRLTTYVKVIRGLNLPGTPWGTSACCERPLLYFHYRSTQTFRFLPEDERKLLSKPPECLCAVIMENVLVHTDDVSHVKPLSKDNMLKVKVNFILERATKVQRGGGGIALLFL